MIGCKLAEPISDPLTSGRLTTLDDRTGGQKLLPLLNKQTGVIVQRLDRIFRDVADGVSHLREWQRQKVALHLADQGGCTLNSDTATGRMILGTLLVFAEFEPDLTAERTQCAMRHKQANGQRMSGRPPYGWAIDPDSVPHKRSGLPTGMVENPEEQAVITLMRTWSEEEDTSLRQIARNLEAKGILCRGKPWGHTTIKRILSR